MRVGFLLTDSSLRNPIPCFQLYFRFLSNSHDALLGMQVRVNDSFGFADRNFDNFLNANDLFLKFICNLSRLAFDKSR